MSVRVKVKATGIIRTITEANYQLSKHKYELLDAPEETPKQAPQAEKKAAEPVGNEQQRSVKFNFTNNELGSNQESDGFNNTILELERSPEFHSLDDSPSKSTTTEESKPKRGRKPKQA
jgi:hypothetical protein